MRYVHNVYKVIDMNGKVDFRGSVPEIAKHYFVTVGMVYAVAEGRYKKLLRQYTLEYDGEEAYIK